MTDTVIQTVVIESNSAVVIPTVLANTPEKIIAGDIYNVVSIVENVGTVTHGQPGPPGPAGISEESMAYAKQIDFVSDNEFYKAEADPGSLTSEAKWRIRKVEILGDGDVSEKWANGNAEFINIWDDRISYTYI